MESADNKSFHRNILSPIFKIMYYTLSKLARIHERIHLNKLLQKTNIIDFIIFFKNKLIIISSNKWRIADGYAKMDKQNNSVKDSAKQKKAIYRDRTETNIIYRRYSEYNRTHKTYTNFSETHITFLNVQITFWNYARIFVKQQTTIRA